MSTPPYLLVASLYLVLFYSCYWLLLRRNTFFGLNRAYLLASVALSAVLPLVELPGGLSEDLTLTSISSVTFTVGSTSANSYNLTLSQWFWLIYGLGVGSMLIRLRLNLRSVFRLIRSGSPEKRKEFTLVRLGDDASPSFSFGRYLVLNRTDALAQPDALLRHEEAHIRQYHTVDILFLEIARVAFWFNPVLWLYKRALQEIHEFLADRAVLKTPQPDYPHQLVAYALNVPSTALITPFVSKSTLKQRIVMLQKPASNRRALLGYALALPLVALLAMCTQEHDLPQSVIAQASAQKSGKVAGGEIFTSVENPPVFPGGMQKLGEYLGQNLKYPEAAQKAKAEGKVFVSFVVTNTGGISDVQIAKGIGFGADAEAARVVKNMPNWQPGTQGGQAVSVKYTLPINFQLEDQNGQQIEKLPPPPPPVPAAKGSALSEPKHFLIDGKEVSEAELKALSPNTILRIDVNNEKGIIAVTTK
ncbi:M56 family metallopeptidase [Spirosoma aureum]|uniref:M56 family metallopeptidase n=1 Tax=Spirosoma aureum TaxID=2692134 RepID=A0A6G9AXX1_9BACT|nr:M56 family metallopeptidase [Spirosoma aureum]QIP17234.1 M56 family metallopeptidase [Spirosoma aureum]